MTTPIERNISQHGRFYYFFLTYCRVELVALALTGLLNLGFQGNVRLVNAVNLVFALSMLPAGVMALALKLLGPTLHYQVAVPSVSLPCQVPLNPWFISLNGRSSLTLRADSLIYSADGEEYHLPYAQLTHVEAKTRLHQDGDELLVIRCSHLPLALQPSAAPQLLPEQPGPEAMSQQDSFALCDTGTSRASDTLTKSASPQPLKQRIPIYPLEIPLGRFSEVGRVMLLNTLAQRAPQAHMNSCAAAMARGELRVLVG